MITDIQTLLTEREDTISYPTTSDLYKDFDWEVDETSNGNYAIGAGVTLAVPMGSITAAKYLFLHVKEDTSGTRLPVEIYLNGGLVPIIGSHLIFESLDPGITSLSVKNDNATAVSIRVYMGGEID